ncbi:ABC transporter permease [Clostridium sp. CH2]|uniref:ABC transporter permease n=1 Tax=Clostridium sp. CH2 TaxID=2949990 RepID=UPI002079D756|nr:ABC transporter permease [Clostridium sp. CH2]
MTYIKIIFKSLFKRKISSVLIMIQLTITIVMLLSSFIMLNSTNYLQDQVKGKGLDLNKTIKLNIYNAEFTDTFKQNYNKLEDYINSIPEVTSFGGFDLTNTVFDELEKNDKYIELRKNIIKDTFKEKYPTSSEMLMIDKGIYNLLNLRITEGRELKQDDFYKDEQKIIPLLAGANYKNVLKIGEILTIKDNNYKYEIVGFIDKNSSWLNDQDYISNMLINLDDKFIIPYNNSEKVSNLDILAKCNAIFYAVNSEDRVNYVNNLIEAKANSLNLRVKNYSISKELLNFKESTNDIINTNLFLSIFLIILSCLGISTVMISSILNRKKEFGIRIATGASINYIKRLIIGEVSFLAISSSIISIAIVFINNLQSYKFNKYNDIGINPMENISLSCILFVFLVMMIIVIITTFLPLKKLKNLQTKDLIGGID